MEESVIRLPAKIRPFLRTMWFLWAAAFLSIIILNVPSQINIIAATVRENSPAAALDVATILARSTGSLVSITLASVLFFKRPSDGMALFLSYFLLVIGIVSTPLYFVEPIWPEVHSFMAGVIQPLIFGPFLVAFLSTFPNGRLVPTWTPWLIVAAILYAPVGPFLFTPEAYVEPTPIYVAGILAWFALIFTGIYAQIHRFRFKSNTEEKQQTKWVVYAFTLSGLFVFISTIWTVISNSLVPGTPETLWSSLIGLGWVLAFSTLPISLTIAVMRYRLYDIDIIINRTLVYGTLTACVIGLYFLVVVGAGLVVQTNVNLTSLLVTAVITTVILRPVHRSLQKGVNRLMYGENAAPSIPSSIPQTNEITTAKPSKEMSNPAASSWLKMARLAWYPAAFLTFGICIAAVPGFIIIGAGGVTDPRFAPNPSPVIDIITWSAIAIGILVSFGSLFLSLLLFRRRSDDRMALLTSFFLLAYGVIITGPLEAMEPFAPGIAILTSSYLIPLFQPLMLLLFAVFPDGRFVPRWIRWVVLAAFLSSPLSLFWTTKFGDPSFSYSDPGTVILVGLNVLVAVTVWVSIIYAQVYRYRRISNTQQKQQTKWILYGLGLLITSQAITSAPWIHSYSLPVGTPYPIWLAAITPIWLVSIAIVPLTLTIAVMRYGLFEVDFIINRSIMYGALTIIVIVIYIVVVGSLGTFFQAQGNLTIALLATGIVAVLFQPLRERLQKGVNRLIYGERDDPAETLSRLGTQLETAVPPDAVLPMLVETIARTLKLPYVGIHVTSETQETTVVEYGTLLQEPVNLPLTYQGINIGRLVVAHHSPGNSFSSAEMRLLQNIGHQAGPAVYAMQLTDALRQSRVRLVAAREEERRRLRRDLHDGLGPILASQGLKIAAVAELGQDDPVKARRLLEEVMAQNASTVTEIRRLVYELRPPALDDLGLVAAVRDYATGLKVDAGRSPRLKAEVQVPPDGLPALPAAIEVAAYRIATEALTNVALHARARHASVSFIVSTVNHASQLQLQIVDDGIGLGQSQRSGVGLISMRERAEEVGGHLRIESSPGQGTRVLVELPLVEVK